MRRLITSVHLAAWISAAAAGQACADGDPVKGEKVFLKCKACHEIATDRNKVGPTLQGVLGRKAGSVGGFKYSEAMLNSQVVWDAETIADYVEKPKEFIAGNKMAFAGLKKEDDIEDLIAFIAASCCS
jgi:cytochrome c